MSAGVPLRGQYTTKGSMKIFGVGVTAQVRGIDRLTASRVCVNYFKTVLMDFVFRTDLT